MLGEIEVSALIVSHGRVAVEKAIQSVLNQTLSINKYEIVVIADKKLEVLKRFEHHKHLTIKYSERTDPGGKWAEALRLASGDIICFLDDDDEWVPDKLEIVMKTFRENSSLGYYHNGHTSIDYDGTTLEGYPELRHYYAIAKIGYFSTIERQSYKSNFQYLSSLGAPFNSSCINIKRELLAPHIDLLSEGMWMVDYFWFYSFAVSDHDILIDTRPLTLYRRRNDATGDFLNNIRNNRKQKTAIYERYLFSHKTYIAMAMGTQLENYLSWMIHKTEIMLWLYNNKTDCHSKLNSIVGMVSNIPKRSHTGLFSSILMGLASGIGFFSTKISLNFVEALERIGLSLI